MYRKFRKSFGELVMNLPFEQLTDSNYRLIVESYLTETDVRLIYMDAYYSIGVHYGNMVGKGILKEQKAFSPDTFPEVFRRFLAQWLMDNAGSRIASVRNTLVEYIVKIISDGIEANKNIRTIANELQKKIRSRSFYGWQALRIARTETTAAANIGALVAGKESNLVLTKEWISIVDSRTRRRPEDEFDHLEMDGVTVDENEAFSVQGDLLQFPGDPNAQAGNVINCRCTVALTGKRDSNGRLVFRE